MRYLPASSTLTMFRRFCLKYVDPRSVTIARFSCFHHTIQDRTKTSVKPLRVRYFNDDIRCRIENIANSTKEILTTTNLNEMKRAPATHFWANMAGAAAFFAPPMLSMIGGYSPLLTGLELKYAATYLSIFGGMSLMNYILTKDFSWESLKNSLLPPAIALTGLLLPTSLGYPVIILGMLVSLYRDIMCNIYPPWVSAIRLFVTTVAVLSMFLMLIGHILFG